MRIAGAGSIWGIALFLGTVLACTSDNPAIEDASPECGRDLDCAAGLYCGGDGTCTRDCVVQSDCQDPDAICDDRGRCVVLDDQSPENPFEEDPDYESVQDLGGSDPSRQPYGTNLGSYRGVVAYSNYMPCEPSPGCWFGIGDGRSVGTYGYEYQCVEYAVRFYAVALDYGGLNGNGDARKWWTAPQKAAGLALEKYANGGTVSPSPDDLIVFDGGTYGHIAVIREVGDDYVRIIQENWFHNASDGNHRLSMTVAGGHYTVSALGSSGKYPVLGWLRRPGACTCADGDGDLHYPIACTDAACPLRDDCDDSRASVFPGASEVCGNSIDEDCSGADLVCPIECSCADGDGDGYFSPSCADTDCTPRTDCNDASASVHPGASEICDNGVDEDCSGADQICPTGPQELASGLNSPWDIALDGTYVYWVENTTTGALRRVPKLGGAVQTLATGLDEPTAVIVDSTYAYVLERSGGTDGCLRRVPLGGGSPEVVVCGLTNAQNHMAQDASTIYFGDYVSGIGGVIKSVPKTAGAVATIIVEDHGLLNVNPPVAVDDTYIYFRNDLNKVLAVPKIGGIVVELGTANPAALRVSGGMVYFPVMSGYLAKIPAVGGALTTIASGLTEPADIALDAGFVYCIEFYNPGNVYRFGIDGGGWKSYSTVGNTIGIEVDADFVYWATSTTIGAGKIMRAPK